MRPAFALLLLVLLSACGQRGPLYLPDEPQPEAVMGTGDQSGETDDQTDWTEDDADADTGDAAGDTDVDKDGKDVKADPATETKN